jgi:putative transposase
MQNADLKNPLEKSYKNIALGSDKFIEKIKEKINKQKHNREISRIKDEKLPSGERIIDIITSQLNIKEDVIFEKRKGNIYRKLALYFLKRYSAISLKDIGKLFNMDYAAVSQAVKRFEKEMEKNRMALVMVKKVTKALEEE